MDDPHISVTLGNKGMIDIQHHFGVMRCAYYNKQTCYHGNQGPFRKTTQIYVGHRTVLDWCAKKDLQVVEYKFSTIKHEKLCRKHNTILMTYMRLITHSMAHQNLLGNANYCRESVQLKPFVEAAMIKTHNANKAIATLLGIVFIPDVVTHILKYLIP